MQIINDPESVGRFRAYLEELSSNLRQSLDRTIAHVEELHQTWKDPQFIEFKSKFDQDIEHLKPLSNEMDEFNEILLGLQHKLQRIIDEPIR